MKIKMILPFGGLPITSTDIGSWYPRVNHIAEISLLNLNYEFWLFIVSQEGMQLILDKGNTEENLRNSIGFRLEAEHALVNLRKQSTYSSISSYTQTIENIEKYLSFLNKAQNELVFSILYGLKINKINYNSSTSIYKNTQVSSSLNRLLHSYLDNNFEADTVFVKVRTQFELVFTTVLCKVLRDINVNVRICLVDHEFENFSVYKLGFDNMLLKNAFDNIVLRDSELIVPQFIEAFGAQGNIPCILSKENIGTTISNLQVLENEWFEEVVPKVDTFLPEYAVSTRLSNKSCYWNKCSFCIHNNKIGLDSYNTNKYSNYSYIRILYKSGYKYFVLNDEAINRADLLDFAKWIIENEIKIHWLFRTRLDCEFDKELIEALTTSGCIGIGFGLESINAATLKSMNKYLEQPSIEYIRKLFKELVQNNIKIHLNLILGYPGEKISDMSSTIQFVEDLLTQSSAYTFTLNKFVLFKDTVICKNSDRFGIRLVNSHNDDGIVQPYEIIDREYSDKELLDFILNSHKRLWRHQKCQQANNGSAFLYNNTLHGIFLRL